MEKDLIPKILSQIDQQGQLNSFEFSTGEGVDHEKVKGNLSSLALKEYVELKRETTERWVLSKDGKSVVEDGTVEYKIYSRLADGPVAADVLKVKIDILNSKRKNSEGHTDLGFLQE